MTLTNVPKGHVATIVTHLEMLEAPILAETESSLSMIYWPNPDVDQYLALFRKVGEPWLWISRLLMNRHELEALLRQPTPEISLIRKGEHIVGFAELDFRETGQCEIAFFGLVPDMNGKGHGDWMMSQVLKKAWRDGIDRVWLHTCTQDSPRALPFYQRTGFRIFGQEIGTMEDPRLAGLFPETAGPHVPLLS